MSVTDRFSGTILPPDSAACNYTVLWFTRKAEGSFGMPGLFFTGVWWSTRWPLGGNGGTRPARTRLEMCSRMCSPAYFLKKKKRITWEFLPATAMRGIWERLAKQKLCLYSDRQWSSADQLGEKQTPDKQGGVRREGELSILGRRGWCDKSFHSFTVSLSLSFLLDRLSTLLTRLTLSLSKSQSEFSHTVLQHYYQDFKTFNCNLLPTGNEIFRFLWLHFILRCPCYNASSTK